MGRRVNRIGTVVGALALGFGGLIAVPTAAQAADPITVGTVAELQSTVAAAVTDTQIVLGADFPQTLPSTIALTSSAGVALEIDGAGRTLYPPASGAHLTATISGTGSLTLRDLTLTVPAGSAATNGGLQLTQTGAATVNLSGLDLVGLRTTALTTGGYGSGDLTVTDSSFVGNTASTAAALLFTRSDGSATSTFQRTTFDSNTGTNGAGYSGGAVRMNASSAGTVSFEDSVFVDNHLIEGGTQPRGGAIAMHNTNVQLHLVRDYFARNSTASAGTPGNADGGAVSSFNSTANTTGSIFVDSSTFEANEAQDDGAALFIEGRAASSAGPFSAQMVVQNSTFVDNISGAQTSDSGGAIQASLRSQITLIHNTFVGNTKANNLGGIDVGGHLGFDLTNGLQSPKISATNNLFTLAKSVDTAYVTCDTNVGCVNNVSTVTAAQQDQLLLEVFGTTTPTAAANGTPVIAGDSRPGRTTAPVTTVRIAPPLADTDFTAYHAATTPTAVTHDESGVAHKAVPDAGSVEMDFVKFDQFTNGGGPWTGATATFPTGDSYFSGAQAAAGWYEVRTPGAAVTFPPQPTAPTDTRFVGWFTEPTGGTQVTSATAQGQTLYAQFAALTYTVSFDSAGGTPVEPITGIASGDTVGAPTDPSYVDHTFGGWLLNGVPYDFGTPVTEDITLVASWTPVAPGPEPTPTPDPTPTPTPAPAPDPEPTPTTPVRSGVLAVADPDATLARTGVASLPLIVLAGLLLIATGASVLAARRRPEQD